MIAKIQIWILSFMLLACSLSALQAQEPPEPPIKIAAIFALSGKAASSNKPSVEGVHLAVNELNVRGGLLGRQIVLLLLDNQSTPIGASLAAREAAKLGVSAIIGSSWSSNSLAVAQIAQQHRIPMISPTSTNSRLTGIGDYIFRVCYSDPFQGKILAEFASDYLKASRAIIFVDLTSDFSLDLSAVFTTHFEAHGGQVVREIEYKASQINYDQQIAIALAESTDIILFSGHHESGLIARKLQDAGATAIPLGTDAWDTPSFFTAGGNRIRRGYYLSHWSAASENPLSRRFVETYGSRTNLLAPTALSYDAIYVLAEAIRRAGTDDHRKIRQTLSTMQGFQGVTGNISFDSQGNAAKGGYLLEIRDGRPHLLKSIEPH